MLASPSSCLFNPGNKGLPVAGQGVLDGSWVGTGRRSNHDTIALQLAELFGEHFR